METRRTSSRVSGRSGAVAPEPAYEPPPEHGIRTTSFAELMENTYRPIPGESQGRFFDERGRSVPLWCAGEQALVRQRCVAIVGTREPTTAGAARARRLARELARSGVIVVSGLAKGIDTEALTAALDAGGRVIAVIGTPLDRAYPAENKRLQERIYQEHLLVSQFPPGQRVYQSNFPVRNRLMAALTDATAIIEAGETSGTLHQASECVRLKRWLFITRSLIDDPKVEWPARFLNKPHVGVLDATDELLAALVRQN